MFRGCVLFNDFVKYLTLYKSLVYPALFRLQGRQRHLQSAWGFQSKEEATTVKLMDLGAFILKIINRKLFAT